jgi:hypothetical protein
MKLEKLHQVKSQQIRDFQCLMSMRSFSRFVFDLDHDIGLEFDLFL